MYLYIFEDGEIQTCDIRPTAHDLAAIDAGILQVIQIVGERAFDIDAKDRQKELLAASLEVGEGGGEYHATTY